MFFSAKTQIYTVHIDPSKPNAVERAVFVREGFNFFAFIFGVFWALYHRMWWVAACLAIVATSFGAAEEFKLLNTVTLAILQIGFNLIIAFQANDLRRAELSRRSYIMSDVVVSDNEFRAQQRYFDRVLAV
jgi:bacteriorhodopsin